MANIDMGGNTLIVKGIRVGVTAPGQVGIATAESGSVNTKQAVNNVNDTTPTLAELTTSFGAPATLGRGFVGTVDDNDGDTNGYIVWASDASFYFLKGTKAS